MTGTVEGNEGKPTGEQGQPTPAASGVPSQPLPDVQLQEQLRTLVQEAVKDAQKSLQKGTDKQIGQIRNDVKRILELKEQGLSESQIQRELQVDALLNQNTVTETPVPGSATPQPTLDISLIDNLLELPANDSRLTDLKLKYANNPAEYLKQASALKASLKVSQPSPAEQLPPEGRTPSRNELDALRVEYDRQIKAAGRGNILKISQIQSNFRKKGLSV